MSLSSTASTATGQLPYLQSLYPSGLLTPGTARNGSSAASGSTAASGGASNTVLQISDQALALQDNATLLGSATGTGTDLQQTLQQLNALALQASGQSSNSGSQTLADAATATLGLSSSTDPSVQNTDLAGTATLLGSSGADASSLLSSLADLSTQYQEQRSLGDLGLASPTDVAGAGTAASASDAPSTPPTNATRQALSLTQTLQQQGLGQLLNAA